MIILKNLIKINPNQTIKQSNRLVVARYRLTKYEQRMMIAVCSQLNKNANEFETVRVRVKDLANFCNFKGESAYNKVHTTILKLMSRTLQIKKDDGKWYITHWLQSAEYLEGGIVEYCIDQRLKPDLLQLKSAYLTTNAEPLMRFNRDYSARMYFILKKMLKIREFERELDYFRDRFQLGKTYGLFANLKNRIIEPALEEINAISDISVRHKYIKEGRAFTKIHFIVELKTDKKEIAPTAPIDERAKQQLQMTSAENVKPTDQGHNVGLEPEKDEISPAPVIAVAETEKIASADDGENAGEKWTPEQQADYDRLLKYGVWAKTAEKYATMYDHAHIERNIQGCLKSNPKGNIRDLGAVIANAIANDTYKGVEEERRKLAEREQERRKAEYEARERAEKEKEEKRQRESEKLERLAKIRVKKSKEELIEIFERVSTQYRNNNNILTPEMLIELETNGIPQRDFSTYQGLVTRHTIKYIQ